MLAFLLMLQVFFFLFVALTVTAVDKLLDRLEIFLFVLTLRNQTTATVKTSDATAKVDEKYFGSFKLARVWESEVTAITPGSEYKNAF